MPNALVATRSRDLGGRALEVNREVKGSGRASACEAAGVVAAAARVLPAHLARAAGDSDGVCAGSLAASAAAALRAFSSVRATPQRLQLAAALLASAVVVAAAYQEMSGS
ncbi:Protein of unknown function [Gryllus bimaculatus]|nr:Protein of unknown function [Gryllus bimaculatus]